MCVYIKFFMDILNFYIILKKILFKNKINKKTNNTIGDIKKTILYVKSNITEETTSIKLFIINKMSLFLYLFKNNPY